MKKRINKKGFTLIELLVVIAIIAILSSVVMASLTSSRVKARDSARVSALLQMRNALTMYYLDNSGIPACSTSPCFDKTLNTALSQSLTLSLNDKNPKWWDVSFAKIADATTRYISKMPVDPSNMGGLKYFYSTGPITVSDYVDKNGKTVNLAGQGVFYAVIEGETTDIENPYTVGVTIGAPDAVEGFGATVSKILGSNEGITGGVGGTVEYSEDWYKEQPVGYYPVYSGGYCDGHSFVEVRPNQDVMCNDCQPGETFEVYGDGAGACVPQ